ncbi:MAG: hypothetical protein GXP39_12315 [Chloroflexi bacterium]|nr:hypothetical protein [Chloroflexota bacterium]
MTGKRRSLYERRASYWAEDLEDRTFEMAVREQLDLLGWDYEDHTKALHRPDFLIHTRVRGEVVRVALEVKEKRQRYRPRWAELAGIDERHLLVQDEVSARLLLAYAPRAFLLFWDHTDPDQPYVLYSIIDLFCIPRRRVRRPIRRQEARFKAKWLLDRRHGRSFARLRDVFAHLKNALARDLDDDLRRIDIHGDFVGETIETL